MVRLGREPDGLRTVTHHVDGVPLLLQAPLEQARHANLVLDDQNTHERSVRGGQ